MGAATFQSFSIAAPKGGSGTSSSNSKFPAKQEQPLAEAQTQHSRSQQPPCVPAAIKAVRAAHLQCDKFVCDLQGELARSRNNEHSRGSTIEGDLEQLVTRLQKSVLGIRTFETQCSAAMTITSKAI